MCCGAICITTRTIGLIGLGAFTGLTYSYFCWSLGSFDTPRILLLRSFSIVSPWQVSFKINMFITAEAIAALSLRVLTAWLQVRCAAVSQSE